MKKFLVMLAIIFAGNIFVMNVHAEVKNYVGTDEYIMSEGENLGVAKERAKQKAIRNAQEQAGIFISSYSKTSMFKLVEDEIIAISGGILKIQDVKFETTVLQNATGISIRATVTATIDTNDINKYLEKNLSERQENAKVFHELQKANEEQDKKIEELKKLLTNANTQQEKEEIVQEIGQQDNIFLSNLRTEVAKNFLEQKNYEQVIKFATDAIELNPENAEAYNERGVAYDYLENYDKSLENYSKAIELNSNYAWAYNNRGNIYNKHFKNYVKALSDYNKAIEIDSKIADFYSNRGTVYNDQKKYDLAISDYDKAIEIDPNFAFAYNNRASVYITQKKYKKAIPDLHKAIEIDSKYAMLYYNLGTIYLEQKKFDEAIENFNKAIELDPDNAYYYNDRGVAYHNLKGYTRHAITDYTKAIERNSNEGLFYDNRGRCYRAIGENKKAEADFKKAKELGYKP